MKLVSFVITLVLFIVSALGVAGVMWLVKNYEILPGWLLPSVGAILAFVFTWSAIYSSLKEDDKNGRRKTRV